MLALTPGENKAVDKYIHTHTHTYIFSIVILRACFVVETLKDHLCLFLLCFPLFHLDTMTKTKLPSCTQRKVQCDPEEGHEK